MEKERPGLSGDGCGNAGTQYPGHAGRAIHDVESVADTISRIKESLEETLQTKFSSAAVAAAGRALKTACGRAARHRTVLGAMTRDEVLALEIEAVQQAQFQLAQEDTRDQERNLYFCVGYSVVCYWLENQVIGSLWDSRLRSSRRGNCYLSAPGGGRQLAVFTAPCRAAGKQPYAGTHRGSFRSNQPRYETSESGPGRHRGRHL